MFDNFYITKFMTALGFELNIFSIYWYLPVWTLSSWTGYFFFSSVEGIPQTIIFQGLFLSLFILLNKKWLMFVRNCNLQSQKDITKKCSSTLFICSWLIVFLHPWEIKFLQNFVFFIVLGDSCFRVSITTFFRYFMFINQDNCPEWFVTMKSVPVIWGSSTLLWVIIMKNFVSRKLYSFDWTSIYLKVVAFSPITFREGRSFLKIVYTCDRICPWKVLLSSYKISI